MLLTFASRGRLLIGMGLWLLLTGAADAGAAEGPVLPRAIPAAGGRVALALPDTAPALADLKLPLALKAGLRISYHAGDSIVAGVSSRLQPVPGKNGQWFDPKTGQNFNVVDVRSSGGVGYVQANVVSAAADLVAIDTRNFQIIDVQRDIAASSGGAAVTGNAISAGSFWVHPALLALVSAEGGPPQPDGVKISRIKHTAAGREFNALSIVSDSLSGWDHSVHDMETGVLLLRTGSAKGEKAQVIDPRTGQVTQGQGATAIYHMMFVGMRELNIPWATQPAPQWVAKGRQLDYGGNYSTTTAMGALPPLGMGRVVQIHGVNGSVALARVSSRYELGGGLPPSDAFEDRYFGSAMFNPLWIAPKSLENLKPNQVLDEDRITKFRTVYQGVQNGAATTLEQGPVESTQFMYDGRSGMLTAVRSTRQQPTGQVQSQLMLTQQR